MEIKKKIIMSMKKGAMKSASKSVSQTCVWWCYQPKVPASLKKLKNK